MLRFSFSLVVFTFVASIFLSASEGSAQSQRADVSPAEMRQIAASAIVNGDPRLGYQLATALLKRDPNDTEALIIRARAARDLGRLPEAVATARRAWGNADTSSERFGASMVMAQALSTSGARTRAQLWLRRAAQNAPSDEFKNIAVRDFRYVQRVNPWATEFSFSAAPNSNINNGSKYSTTQLFDLPFEFQLSGAAQALSGFEYSLGVATRYRLAESNRSQNDLIFQLDHRTYTLSDEAKQLAPNVEGADFEYSTAGLSYIRRGFTGSGDNKPYQFEFSAGRTWYGRSPFMQYARVGITQNFVTAPGQLVFLGLNREYQQSMSNRADVDSWTIRTGMRVSLANRDRLTLSLSAKKSNSVDANLDYNQVRLSARYSVSKPIAGVSVNFGVSLSQKIHDVSNFTRFGRQDQTVSLDVTGVFKQIEYFGFSPSVTVSARKTQSNVGLYESQGIGLRMGIQSSF
ncbi:tetratricopeptide repeat protein [Planktotalea sp.]|uniref:tetratricopeptide repeat protein n=1 Tax=Planktotalea sp. TaxID=2029877 RepID=UPI003299BE30